MRLALYIFYLDMFSKSLHRLLTRITGLLLGKRWKEKKNRAALSLLQENSFQPGATGSYSVNSYIVYRADDRGERIPEWADGPTTMDDMIELKGFDEPAKIKKKNGKADKQIPKTEKEKSASRPSSRGNASGIESGKLVAVATFSFLDKKRGPECDATVKEAARTTLPVSDVELAELLGLMDLPPGMPTSSKSENSAEGGLSGSRMSRFFKNVQSASTG